MCSLRAVLLSAVLRTWLILSRPCLSHSGPDYITRDLRRAPGVIIGTAGMQADMRTLHKMLQARRRIASFLRMCFRGV